MACYAYSVLTRWFSSVYCGAGSETALSKQSKQVVIASSMTPMDVNDISSRPETTDDVPESCQEPNRKGGDTAKVIIIPTETANYIMGHAHSAFVSTRTMSDMEDALICDGGATCTLTKTLENCTQCKPKVVEIQTAQGATIMSTTHLCLKTYYVRDRLGEIRPIVVKAYVVPGLKYDLLSVKGLNKCGYAVFHHPDPEESGVYAVINKKTDKAKSFPFMSEHSNLFYLKLEQMSAKRFEKQWGYELWHRRLGHASFRNIRDAIKCVNGLESLKHMTCDTHVKCPSCMTGKAFKASLEDLPKTKKVITKPLYQINMDSFSSSVKSIEGYFQIN